WMHDINKHVSAEALRRASAATDGVKEVIEMTKELAAALASRELTPTEPFAGMSIAAWPEMQVLGPSLSFYRGVIEEFTKVSVTMPVPLPLPRARLSDLSALRALATPPTHRHLVAALARSVSVAPSVIPPPMFGALRT